MTKHYKNTGQKDFNIGRVFHKCKQSGCQGAATEDTLGYCFKHWQKSSALQGSVADVAVVMDTVRIRSKGKGKTAPPTRKSGRVVIGDNITGAAKDHGVTNTKDTHFVLHIGNEDQVTYHYSQDPDLEESSEHLDFTCTESRARRKRCIGPSCFNKGSSEFKGLCRECYQILRHINQQEDSLDPSFCPYGNASLGQSSNRLNSVHSANHRMARINHESGHSCLNSHPTDIQKSDSDTEKEQPNLIDLSLPEVPFQRQLDIERKALHTVNFNSHKTHATKNVNTEQSTTNLIDLSLTETTHHGEDIKRRNSEVSSNSGSFGYLPKEMQRLNLLEEVGDARITKPSAVNLDLRLPHELSKTATACYHGDYMQPEVKRSSTATGGHKEGTRGSYRKAEQHKTHFNKDAKTFNIATTKRKPVQSRTVENHSNFEQLIEDIEQQSKTSATKCLAEDCKNFGNNRCMGLCNSCYNKVNRSWKKNP